jgi:hypothetical protein
VRRVLFIARNAAEQEMYFSVKPFTVGNGIVAL